jgi:release factor glutamine methyltransferase
MATPDVQRASTPLGLVEVTAGYFRDKGIENPRLDAEVLLAHVLGTERIGLYLHFDKPLQSGEVDRYRELVRRRARGEPAAYLVGRKEFWSLDFAVGPGVLVPRPDTERLVEGALDVMGEAGRFAELGVGSGAVSVALLSERPGWSAAGVDCEVEALETARRNAAEHLVGDRLELRHGDLFEPLKGETFDLVVSNPPYIPSADIEGLSRDVAGFEPRIALDGGPDGLCVIRRILEGARDFLREGGWLLLEFGAGQAPGVVQCLDEAGGYGSPEILSDYAGLARVCRVRKK